MNCPLCKSNVKFFLKHKTFLSNVLRCDFCQYSFEQSHMEEKYDTLEQQINNSSSFGKNIKRNSYYANILNKISQNIKINKILEIGTPKDFDFLKRVRKNLPNLKIYSHDIIKNVFPNYIIFSSNRKDFYNKNIDITFCIHTLEHIPVHELKSFINFCKSISKYYIFEIPCCENYERTLKSTTQPHYSFFSEHSIKILFGNDIEVSKNENILKFNNLPFNIY